MINFSNVTLKNKIFLSNLAVILAISAIIALLARWILVSSLTEELELRGVAIAHSIAERGGEYILDNDQAKLLNLIFDEANLRERQHLINYIYVLDKDNKVISHTFTSKFPKKLETINSIPAGKDKSVLLVNMGGVSSYDIAVPIKEGLYKIGTAHVGLSKVHIDNLVSKLRITFLGFISLVVVITFILSHKLSKYITNPVDQLIKVSDEFSKGNFDINMDVLSTTAGWDSSTCPVYKNTDFPCWHFDQISFSDEIPNLQQCTNCHFYMKREGDEVVQLADSFKNMVWSIKLYRHRLRESEEKYKSLFDSGPDPIIVIDCETFNILDINPRVNELYGYTKEELIGKNFSLLGSESCAYLTDTFNDYGTSGGCIYVPKLIQKTKDNKIIYVNMHACPISYKSHFSFIIAVNDITSLMEKDAQLVQAAKMKSLGEMSAGVAHEVNQPLNAIKIGSEFLAFMAEQNKDVPAEQLKEVANQVSTQVDRAAEIISALRAFGRKADFKVENVNLNSAIENVLPLLTKQFELQKIFIKLSLSSNLPTIPAQHNKLQQVFFNIINNAKDAIIEKREELGVTHDEFISIKTYFDNGKVYAEVKDTGMGMSEEVRAKIFEPFFSTKEVGYGMGLGLAITYGIIQDHNGFIEIESQRKKGASFIISFNESVAKSEK